MKILIHFLLACLIGASIITVAWFIDRLTGEPFGISGVGIYVVGGLIAVAFVASDAISAKGYWEDME